MRAGFKDRRQKENICAMMPGLAYLLLIMHRCAVQKAHCFPPLPVPAMHTVSTPFSRQRRVIRQQDEMIIFARNCSQYGEAHGPGRLLQMIMPENNTAVSRQFSDGVLEQQIVALIGHQPDFWQRICMLVHRKHLPYRPAQCEKDQ